MTHNYTMQQAIRYADKCVSKAPDNANLKKVRADAIEAYFIQATREEEAAENAFNNGQFGVGA